ncbi:NAD-dependent epimerase/dehydratase family protein [Uliginosibacterium aquaticum]|uniref:NAD-dependent epimerase/dehydratase family protein n=1 Tax=Uliginosibacterium aquaticum TaxID=2731212 RepID=A0ABX2IDX3_9RHOO|nr:NAD-dependent epimerase/dehydratase family protein [Uliginosibacterium aquaticum]NSL54708.1 NAD-dependent epimerase/dehydratase family protein [Uliginosibacterium aquaticum]
MHVLVTGGAGFIGSHLVERHMQQGDSVHVVDNLSTGQRTNIQPWVGSPKFQFDEADILTWGGLEKASAWADRIYHLAAVVGVFRVLEDPVRVLATNIAGTERLLRFASAGHWKPQIIIASSSEVYGPTSAPLLEEEAMLYVHSGGKSRWSYAISKLSNETQGLAYARQHELPICIVRLFNTIGLRQRGQYGMVVPRFVQQVLRGGPLTIYGDGQQTRSFCDARDTAAALDALAGLPGAAGEIVNVGNDREISIRALADLVCERAQRPVEKKFLSYVEAYGEQYDDIQRRRPSLAKLQRLTGFRHRWTLESTLDELIAQHRDGSEA